MSVLKCHCGGQLEVMSRLDYYLHTICIRCGANSSDSILSGHFRKNSRKQKRTDFKHETSIQLRRPHISQIEI